MSGFQITLPQDLSSGVADLCNRSGRIIFVSSALGTPSGDGRYAYPFRTFGEAIALATAMVPSTASPVLIQCLDAETYVESIAVPAHVRIEAKHAKIMWATEAQHVITLDDESWVTFREVEVGAGNAGAIVRIATAGRAYAYVEKVIVTGGPFAGGVGNLGSAASVLFARIETLIVNGDGSFGIVEVAEVPSGHMHVQVGDIYLGGDNTIGLARVTEGHTVCKVEHMLEIGTPSNAIMVYVAAGEMNLIAHSIIASGTALVVTDPGVLNAFVNALTGATSGDGTLNLTQAGI